MADKNKYKDRYDCPLYYKDPDNAFYDHCSINRHQGCKVGEPLPVRQLNLFGNYE